MTRVNEMYQLTYPWISIIIPTRNEEESLPVSLRSVLDQDYPNCEIIIVDSNSTDTTKEIGLKNGARVINYDGKPLGARLEGIKAARADYVLFLDADQILEAQSIKEAVKSIQCCDMLVLEETSYNPETWTQRVIATERKILHKYGNTSLNNDQGLYPRFFKKDILLRAYSNIPPEILPLTHAHDDEILFFELKKISLSLNILPNAVKHIEEKNIFQLIIHNYNFGISAKAIWRIGFYNDILYKPVSLKLAKRKLIEGTIIIILLRSISYRIGFLLG